MILRPAPSEHNPYFSRYIDLVPEGEFLGLLRDTWAEAQAYFQALPPERHDYRYAPGKWSVKEVLMHLIDTERIMAFRAFVAGRGDQQMVLSSMDENFYASRTEVSGRSMASLLEEFSAVRHATLQLFAHLSEADSQTVVQCAGFPATARAMGYVIAGHVLHHLRILRERYA